MNSLKYANALRNFHGHQGPQTRSAILAEIGPELIASLTGAQVGSVMDAMQRARANAKAEAGGFDVCDDSLYVPSADRTGGMLVPLLALRAIKRETSITHRPAHNDPTQSFADTINHYTLDFSENF